MSFCHHLVSVVCHPFTFHIWFLPSFGGSHVC
jgi:hypothetical protein